MSLCCLFLTTPDEDHIIQPVTIRKVMLTNFMLRQIMLMYFFSKR